MLRVCLVGLIAGGHSGIPRYASALTNALDRVAPDFPELSLRLLTTERGAHEAAAHRIGVDVVRGPLATASAGWRRIVAEQVHARRADADLLHFFDLTGPVLAPRRSFTATVHDAALRHGFASSRLPHKSLLQPWSIRRATATVAVSAFARDEAVERFGADPARIRVIHSGPGLIGDETADPPPSAVAPSPNGAPYMLYVGNLAVHKNLPFLVRAFGAAGVDARLLLVGRRGARFEEVRQAVESSPARDRIEIRGDASDAEVDRLYRGASGLLLPSRYEGFGFTALEAMARGCPVLASDIPALREVSGDGALLLPLDDQPAWSDAMRRVVSDAELGGDLRRRGTATARRYSWEATARGVCRFFLDVSQAPA
ncbi:MAG TPA: glycosyltransferase family 1 protein [Solirubrobacteraceae bacterium]|nr:glycosyltransferase family 1 protein [Solirubrobacteraceae bacterium]